MLAQPVPQGQIQGQIKGKKVNTFQVAPTWKMTLKMDF